MLFSFTSAIFFDFFFFQAEDGIRDTSVTGVQTCALPILEFNEKWRLNLGIMYDVVNSLNSPLRTQYFMRNAQQQLLPVIYRITFFFPLGGSDDDGDDFDEE